MPTDTFNKLSEEKKSKIITAAKREFSRVSLKEASIKNIVEYARIARGSFYQYFDSKEDLLQYLLKEHIEGMNNNFEKTLKRTNGDIFEVFISIYDYIVNECMNKREADFFKRIFEDIKTNQDNVLVADLEKYKPENYYDIINKTNLKIKSVEEFKLLNRMLHAVTKKAIVCSLKYESKEKAREDYLEQLEYIKYGVLNS